MKRILTLLCVLAIVMAGSAALAAEPEAGQSASCYPFHEVQAEIFRQDVCAD